MARPSGDAVGFELIDHHGHAVTAASYHGRHALVFFGFTHCRVVCPRALARLAGVLEDLGPLADRIQPLYVTVDPERDTPERMRAFLESYPRFTGLTGSRDQIDHARHTFRVFADKLTDATAAGGYDIRHTAITYILDPEGRLVDHLLDAVPGEEVAARLRARLDR